VDFVGGARAVAGAGLDDEADPQFDAVFSSQVLNWEQGKAWRARRPATADGALRRGRGGSTSLLTPGVAGTTAFDETNPEVRIKIDTTGVYSLDFDSLA